MALALDLGALQSRLKREKAQGGDITISLIWNDPSDLDLHCHITPNGKSSDIHIFYGNKKAANGHLDVDMNVADKGKGFSLEPVENIFFKDPIGGKYKVVVRNACLKVDKSMWPQPQYQDPNRKIPFKVFLNKDGAMKTFEGKITHKDVTAFTFNVAGSGSTGGGNYLVLPPESSNTTFKDLCSKHKIAWKIGGGYYAVARSEKIHAYKEMLLQDIKNDKFTVGSDKCRKALGWAASGELKKGPKDIKENHRLFVQSTSANRVIPPGTHVLFEVSAEEYAAHRKAKNTKFEQETHTMGKSAAAKGAAKAAAKAGAKAAAKAGAKAAAKAAGKAKAAPKEAAAPKAGAKRAASPKGAPAPKRAAGGGGGLSGKAIVFTGTLTTPRAAATAAATAAGARILGAVSSSTNILVAGPGAGSKMAKAQALGVEVWDEAKFRRAAGL